MTWPLDIPTNVRRALLCLLCVAPALPSSLPAQTVGWTHDSRSLYRVELVNGRSQLSITAAGETELPLHASLALSMDGTLYATVYQSFAALPSRLSILNQEDGSETVLAPLPAPMTDLVVDADGEFWAGSSSGGLYRIDPLDGSTTAVPIGDFPFETLASHDGALYGIGRRDGEWYLARLDPDAGSHEILRRLEPFLESSTEWETCDARPSSMSFDDDGGLWILFTEITRCIIVPIPRTKFRFYREPFGDRSGWNSAVTDPSHLSGLAIQGSTQDFSVVDVPTLDPLSALGFALALVGLAWARLRLRMP